jgi:DNA replication protein DnaC
MFQVITQRYEKSSLIITTNVTFQNWGKVFPESACVTPMLDRLTHHADVFLFEGHSYRRREAEEKIKSKQLKKKVTQK